jgi:cytidylate kinase
MQTPIPVIAIDGPSGTGKGTIAQLLASRLGWHMLDSGALYRIVAIGAEQQHIALDDSARLSRFAGTMNVAFSGEFTGSITLDGREISAQVRLEESGAKASVIAALPEVRTALLQRQRDFRQPPGLVADGRDMGTVVFPDACAKFFLTASAEVRAERRYNQLINKGVNVSLRTLLGDIRLRDERDSQREVAPMVPAADAIIIDTSGQGADEVFAQVLHKAQEMLHRSAPK